jgi:hypothetical protein
MEHVELFDNYGVAFDLAVDEIQSVARRQLVGSFVVAVVTAVAAAFMALTPVHYDAAVATAHNIAVTQQPVFVAPPGRRVASLRQHELELP